jgi:cardiolipin-specific phospholipase
MPRWCRFSPEVLDSTQAELLERAGITYECKRVWLDDGNYIYCIQCGDPSKQPLVLIHGYLGSGVIFFRILKQLTDHFFVITLDLLGMGRSSRPEWKAETLEEAEDFFVNSIEEFRRGMSLESFLLAGHSFGGYISGCYALKHPQHVAKLLLLSPVGIPEKPAGYSLKEKLKNRPWLFKAILKTVNYLWVKKNVTPGSMLRKAGPFSGKLIRLYTRKRLASLPLEEIKVLEKYLEQINLLPGSGEFALVHILEEGAWARHPLAVRLPRLEVPMAFIYGDRDWMDSKGAYAVRDQASVPVVVKVVKNSDHHLYWDNPEEFAEAIVECVEELDGRVAGREEGLTLGI